MNLVALFETAQDRDRIFDIGLADDHGLEAAFERGVFLDMLAVLVQCGRTDAVEFSAGECGLEHVGRIRRAFCGARAHDGVQFVDEQDYLAVGF